MTAWRFWPRLPGWGGMAVLDRSWYGRVLVERVEEYATHAQWSRAYDEINAFERLLAGSVIERKGERWCATAGGLFLAACSIATGLSPSYGIAMVAWALAGVGSAVTSGAMFSYILKVAHKDRVARTLSFFFGAFNIGFVAGGFIGGWLWVNVLGQGEASGWLGALVIATIGSIIVLFIIRAVSGRRD